MIHRRRDVIWRSMLLLFLLVGFGCSESQPALVPATEASLEFPESVVWAKANSAWYVSNFGGTVFVYDTE